MLTRGGFEVGVLATEAAHDERRVGAVGPLLPEEESSKWSSLSILCLIGKLPKVPAFSFGSGRCKQSFGCVPRKNPHEGRPVHGLCPS